MSKIAITILSAAILFFAFSFSFSKSVRFFSGEHPGIILVAFAVWGELVCDWNQKKSFKERLKKFFGMVLVAGLLIEIREAVKTDRHVADIQRDAATAELQAGEAKERAANLESNNIVMKSKLSEIDVQISPRIFSDFSVHSFLGKYQLRDFSTSTNERIHVDLISDPDEEPISLREQFQLSLLRLGWHVHWSTATNGLLRLGSGEDFPIPPGVNVMFCAHEFPPSKKDLLEWSAAFDLLGAITNSGIVANWYFKEKIDCGHIVVFIGKRPDKYESEWLKSNSIWEQMCREDLNRWKSELQKAENDNAK